MTDENVIRVGLAGVVAGGVKVILEPEAGIFAGVAPPRALDATLEKVAVFAVCCVSNSDTAGVAEIVGPLIPKEYDIVVTVPELDNVKVE